MAARIGPVRSGTILVAVIVMAFLLLGQMTVAIAVAIMIAAV